MCLQEVKLTREAFTALLGTELAARGYAFAVHGQAQWNGVAILSRAGLVVVAIFALTWVAALAIWRFGKIEQKWDARQVVTADTAD